MLFRRITGLTTSRGCTSVFCTRGRGRLLRALKNHGVCERRGKSVTGARLRAEDFQAIGLGNAVTGRAATLTDGGPKSSLGPRNSLPAFAAAGNINDVALSIAGGYLAPRLSEQVGQEKIRETSGATGEARKALTEKLRAAAEGTEAIFKIASAGTGVES